MDAFINVHTHIFSINHVPEFVVGQDRWLIPVSVRRFGGINNLVLKPLSPVIGLFTGRKSMKRLTTFAQLGLATDQEDQWHALTDYYKGLGHDFRFVVLPMDMEQMGGGNTQSNVYTQLAELVELRKNPEIASRMLPFVPVDPRRPEFRNGNDVLRFVRTYVEKFGFAGIKLYPALGYFPFDPRLYEMYRWAIDCQIPIMVHCIQGVIHWQGTMDHWESMLQMAQGLTHYSNDPKWDQLSGKDKKKARDVFQRNFTQPNNYEVLIDLLKASHVPNADQLKLCLGHFGMDDDDWYKQCCALVKKYPNFYADISYVVAQSKTMPRLKETMLDPVLKSKTLFGTDFFVVSKEKREDEILKSYLEQVKTFQPYAEANAKKYLQINLAGGVHPINGGTPHVAVGVPAGP